MSGSFKSKVLQTEALPDDMQDVLMSFFGEFELDVPTSMKTKMIPLSAFPVVDLADGVNDERGIEYAEAMVGQVLPPIVVYGGKWLDGRHRVWAAKHGGAAEIEAIDIADYLPPEAVSVIEPIADLSSSMSPSVTQNPHFKSWFRASKVVGSDGDPLVVYHGTTKEFSVFRPGADGGIHFGDEAAAGWRLADLTGFEDALGNRVVAAYLSIKNPLNLDYDPGTDAAWGPVIARAKAHGYDGISYPNAEEIDEDDDGNDVTTTSWVAFRPEQIKSAFELPSAFNTPLEGKVVQPAPLRSTRRNRP